MADVIHPCVCNGSRHRPQHIHRLRSNHALLIELGIVACVDGVIAQFLLCAGASDKECELQHSHIGEVCQALLDTLISEVCSRQDRQL